MSNVVPDSSDEPVESPSENSVDTGVSKYQGAAETIVDRAQPIANSDTGAATPAELDETVLQTAHEPSGDDSTGGPRMVAEKQLNGQFGRYEIIEELGRGNMGTVYLARDTQLDREVALKVPQFTGDNHSDQVDRFYREARAMATVRHSGLCPVFDVGEIEGIHYLTMAYIEGRPLSEYTKSGKTFPGLQVAALIRKLALALNEAHKNGIIHRDLKPANIMIDKRNEPIIMDFGLARRRAGNEVRLTQTGSILGTPAYMSPEQVDGDLDKIGPASDLYSLGVICYQMLAGKLPFTGSFGKLMVQVMTKAPPPLSAIPEIQVDPKLEAICLKLMSKEPQQRQGSAAELSIELRNYLKEPVATPIPSAPPEQQKTKKADKPRRRKAKPVVSPNESVTDQLAAELFADMEWELPPRVLPAHRRKNSRKRSRGKSRGGPAGGIWIACGFAAALILCAVIVISVWTKEGTIRVAINDPDIKVAVKGTEIVIQQADKETDIKLSPGEHTLLVERGDLKFETDTLTLRKGETIALRVELLADRVEVHQGKELIGKEELSPGAADGTGVSSGRNTGERKSAKQPPVTPPGGILAHYKFDGNAKDSSGKRGTIQLSNTEFRQNAVYLNGKYDFEAGYRAEWTTPELDYRKFTVAVRFRADDFHETLGTSCVIIGGTSHRWFGLRRTEKGNLVFALNNHSFKRDISKAKIEKARWVVIACGVDLTQNKATVFFNSAKVASIDLPMDLELKVMHAENDDRIWTFTDYSTGGVFHGVVDEVIVYDRLLSDAEFGRVPLRP